MFVFHTQFSSKKQQNRNEQNVSKRLSATKFVVYHQGGGGVDYLAPVSCQKCFKWAGLRYIIHFNLGKVHKLVVCECVLG